MRREWFANTTPPKTGTVGLGPGSRSGDAYKWPEPEPEPNPTYRLTVENGFGSGVYSKDAPVSIVADPPPAPKRFYTWSGGYGGVFDDRLSANTTFTMPGHDATVTAYYTEITPPPPEPGETWEYGTYAMGIWHPNFQNWVAAEGHSGLFWRDFEPFAVGTDPSHMLWALKARGSDDRLQIFISGFDMGALMTMGANQYGVFGTGDSRHMFNGPEESGWEGTSELDIYPSNFTYDSVFDYVIGTDETGAPYGAGLLRPTWMNPANFPMLMVNRAGLEVSGHVARHKYGGQVYSISHTGSAFPFATLTQVGEKTNYKKVFGTLAIDEFGTLLSRRLGHGPDAQLLDDYEPVPRTGDVKFHTIVKSGNIVYNSTYLYYYPTVGAIDQNNTLWICGTTGAGLGMEPFENTDYTELPMNDVVVGSVKTSSYRAKSTDNYFIPRLANVKDAFFIEDHRYAYTSNKKCVALMTDGTLKITGGVFNIGATKTTVYNAAGEELSTINTSVAEIIDRNRDRHILYGVESSGYIVNFQENVAYYLLDGSLFRREKTNRIGFYTYDFVPIPTDITGYGIWATTDLVFLHGGRKKQGGEP